MKPRVRMQIVADVGDPAVVPGGRFHTLIILEGQQTGDKRLFVENSLSWRDLPFPLQATDEASHGEIVVRPTVLIGNFDKIERQGLELHGWGAYISNPDEEAARLIELIQKGELTGLSADIDEVEFEILFPVVEEEESSSDDEEGDGEEGGLLDIFAMPEMKQEEVDGVKYDVMPIDQPLMRVTEGRIMGATVVPFGAFQEAFIEDESGKGTDEQLEPAIAASAGAVFARHGVTGAVIDPLVTLATGGVVAAGTGLVGERGPETVIPLTKLAGRETALSRFQFPDIPPREWFEVPETPGPMPLTILDSGQVFGHLAVWGECHIGFSGECVEPPRSPSNYARFHVGEIPVDDGGRVSVGRLTFGAGGHADRSFNAAQAQAHYDRSCNVAADIVAVDGEYGIWVCGGARSTLSLAEIREVMSAPPSGDWRRFGRALDMVAALCVNVPGFNTPRALVRKEDGLVASLIVTHPAPPLTNHPAGAATRRIAERIAASIGRDTNSRIAALAARVHGGR